MRKLILIFLSTITILLIGILFGYEEISKSYEMPEEFTSYSVPIDVNIDL